MWGENTQGVMLSRTKFFNKHICWLGKILLDLQIMRKTNYTYLDSQIKLGVLHNLAPKLKFRGNEIATVWQNQKDVHGCNAQRPKQFNYAIQHVNALENWTKIRVTGIISITAMLISRKLPSVPFILYGIILSCVQNLQFWTSQGTAIKSATTSKNSE